MNCPLCAATTLLPTTLEMGLTGHSCPQCEGIFLRSDQYWTWRRYHGVDLPETADTAPAPLDPEPTRAKQCPYCRHILLPYQVGLELPFTVDHCGGCNSMWFDRGEWHALQRRNLHDNLHQMFSEPWQRRLRVERRRIARETIYAEKFGDADYAQIRSIRAWIDAHPHAAALRAYLNARDPYQD